MDVVVEVGRMSGGGLLGGGVPVFGGGRRRLRRLVLEQVEWSQRVIGGGRMGFGKSGD